MGQCPAHYMDGGANAIGAGTVHKEPQPCAASRVLVLVDDPLGIPANDQSFSTSVNSLKVNSKDQQSCARQRTWCPRVPPPAQRRARCLQSSKRRRSRLARSCPHASPADRCGERAAGLRLPAAACRSKAHRPAACKVKSKWIRLMSRKRLNSNSCGCCTAFQLPCQGSLHWRRGSGRHGWLAALHHLLGSTWSFSLAYGTSLRIANTKDRKSDRDTPWFVAILHLSPRATHGPDAWMIS